MKKIGRPKSENPLTIEIKARIDKETKDKLAEYCRETGKTVTDVIREGIKTVIEKQ